MNFEQWYEANKELLTTMSLEEKLRRAWNEASNDSFSKEYDDGYNDGYDEGLNEET